MAFYYRARNAIHFFPWCSSSQECKDTDSNKHNYNNNRCTSTRCFTLIVFDNNFFIGDISIIIWQFTQFSKYSNTKLRNSLLSISRDIFQFYYWLDEKLNGQLLKILNWLVPVGYVMVVTVCFQQFLTHTLPMLSSPGLFRLFTIYFSMVLIYASTILAAFSDPGE